MHFFSLGQQFDQHVKKIEILTLHPGYNGMVKKPSHATVPLTTRLSYKAAHLSYLTDTPGSVTGSAAPTRLQLRMEVSRSFTGTDRWDVYSASSRSGGSSYPAPKHPVLRIRIEPNRIRIQHFCQYGSGSRSKILMIKKCNLLIPRP